MTKKHHEVLSKNQQNWWKNVKNLKKKKNVIQLNLLFSAELPSEGDAALLTRALELVSLEWLAPMYPPKGPSEERFMFRAAATDMPAGTSVWTRLFPPANVVGRLNWSDNKFWVWVFCVWANCVWSKELARKFVFKRFVNTLPDPSEAAKPRK